MRNLGVIVLAAGGSSRFGAPKQLADLGGIGLAQKVCQTAQQLHPKEIVLVTGATPLTLPGIRTVQNEQWKEGLSASIRTGIQSLKEDTEACLILLADQPLVTTDHLRQLTTTKKTIAASQYPSGRLGVPALFQRQWFQDLQALQGDTGARPLLERHKAHVAKIPFNQDADVDTPADLERLRSLLLSEASDSGIP